MNATPRHIFSSGRILIILVCAAIWTAGCKKDEPKPAAPVIAFKSISATQVVPFENTLRITFTYEDHQGDLGDSDPDAYALRIKDDRLAGFDWYHVPPMTPGMQELHIRGEYAVELDPLFLLGNGGTETTRFTLQLRDRAGNWSNQVTTPTVTIGE
jgi:hypothetical protein